MAWKTDQSNIDWLIRDGRHVGWVDKDDCPYMWEMCEGGEHGECPTLEEARAEVERRARIVTIEGFVLARLDNVEPWQVIEPNRFFHSRVSAEYAHSQATAAAQRFFHVCPATLTVRREQ